MRILIAEKDRNGRSFLDRMLRLEGHQVIVASDGADVKSLVKETRPDMVLMNVFKSLHAGKPPVGKISIGCMACDMPVVFVNCAGECEQLGDFTAEENDACDALFDRLPAKVKIDAMEHIHHLCSTLRRYKRLSQSNTSFNWHRAVQNIDIGLYA